MGYSEQTGNLPLGWALRNTTPEPRRMVTDVRRRGAELTPWNQGNGILYFPCRKGTASVRGSLF